MSSNRLRRALATAFAAALATGGLVTATTAPAAAAEGTGLSPNSVITDATFIWGVSGYAQQGVFGPWVFKEFSGDAEFLQGDVGTVPEGASVQSEYRVEPTPVTSFPSSLEGKAPNAVKFTGGTGAQIAGVTTISWEGSYVFNPYPPFANAPDETYANPVLTVNADGSGELTLDIVLPAGEDQEGNPTEAQNVEDVTAMTFSPGDLAETGNNAFRVTPDYQGVVNGLTGQTTACSTDGGVTGWWGSWPQEFIDVMEPAGLGAHYYSSDCGGSQDKKPALPFDVTYDTVTPTVTVSETNFDVDAEAVTVTVNGTGFLPELSEATRAPICPAGPPAPCGKSGGYYIAFGKFAETWQPSASGTRTVVNGNADLTKWANPESNGYVAPNDQNVVLNEDGSFTAQITVDKSAVDAANPPATNTQYGIAVYPAGGGTTAIGEVLVPITFVDPAAPVEFNDIEGILFQPEIEWLSTQGITTGYDNGNGTFSYAPSAQVLREQMAAFLYRFEHAGANPDPVEGPSEFVDVPATHVFKAHIAWLASTGITTGYDNGDGTKSYAPAAPVLREQMAAFLYRLAGSPEWEGPAVSPFTDLSTSHVFYDEITWLADTEITTGYDNGNGTKSFQGSAPVLREQMAAFLFRFNNLDLED